MTLVALRTKARALVRAHRLQTRIVLAFVGLLCALQVAALLTVHIAGTSTSEETLAKELVNGERVFSRILDQNAEQLAQGGRILSSDYAFREAVATKDRDTIVSALTNHGARIKSDLMLLTDLEHHVIADTLPTTMAGHRSALAPLLTLADSKGSASAVIHFDHAIYQVVVVPVLAPIPIAWVVMGFRLDDTDALDLQRLTGLQVSFLSRNADNTWTLEGTTLTAALGPALVASISHHALEQTKGVSTIRLDDSDYMTLISTENMAGDGRVIAVLQRPVDDALKPFRRLQNQILAISAFALVLALACSLMIARGIARPVHRLAAFARSFAAGEQTGPIDIRQDDEIGELATAFDQMRQRITDRESRILDLAYRDALTGLPNRALFSDRVEQQIALSGRLGKPLTIVMMDLDRFKWVNDSLGHQGGDLLLIEVGKRLQDVIRRRSDTLARMGGDEFAVLLPTEDACDVRCMVGKMQACLETPMTINGHLVDARASFGIATCPEHGSDLVTLLRHADSAMYVAKRNNTGAAIYDPRYDHDSHERLSLMTELRQAVERDELILHYQPKVDLKTPGALSVECLVRWIHATRGFVSPDAFIPFAEQTGYISVITEWVIRHALAQLRRWRDMGLDVHMSINISTRDLMNLHFADLLATMLDASGCSAEWIMLEITETSILDNPGQAQQNIQRLHEQGCRISIDDFGTGYSSLAYLKGLRVDELKIDKSFVMDMADHPGDPVIIRSTIDLGHNMGLKVVAEGVETEAALLQLRAMGCDLAQGYLMSRPLSADELTRWMRESTWVGRRPQPLALEAALAA